MRPRSTRPIVRAGLSTAQLCLLAILAGGATGALARAAVARELLPHAPGTWPWATFSVNLIGALLLAWLTTRLTEMVAPTRYWRFLLGTGLCGALTTFSTFQVETIALANDGHAAMAAGYAAASLSGGMAVAVAATVVARRRRYG
ncbi:MAG TPA: fluoride efflux transporter CrcB [Conexibacter sp.]|nr:fluoride efflux transporter CrcB [Conexibacter sp.]